MNLFRGVGILTAVFLAWPALGFAAIADFTGNWHGTGTLTTRNTFGGTTITPCSLIDISIEHLAEKLTVQRYHALCGSIDSDWGPSVLEIREGKIFEDGEQTGTLQDNLLKTLQRQGAVQYAFNLKLIEVDGKPVLETYYGVRNAAGARLIEGDLSAL